MLAAPFETIDRHLRYLGGRAWYHLGQHARAREAYSRLIERHPDDARGYVQLARCYRKLREQKSANRVLEAAASRGIEHPMIDARVAEKLRKRGDFTGALVHAERAAAVEPGRPRTQNLLRLLEGDFAVYRDGRRPRLERVAGYRSLAGRILHLLETSLPQKRAGYTFRSHYILRGQRELGLESAAVTRGGFPADQGVRNPVELEVIDGVPYQRADLDGYRGFSRCPLDVYLTHHALAVRSLAERERPELLHAASNFKNGVVARAVAEACSIPWVYEVRGVWEDTGVANGIIAPDSDRYRYHREMETECMRAAHAVVTLSDTMKREICSRGVDPETVFVVPNGVDVDRFPVVERDAELARQLGVHDAPVIGYVGTFSAYEGLDTLVRAHAKLVARLPAARLLLVGDGKEADALRGLARSLDVADSVVFTGRVDHGEVLRHYSLIDVFALPRKPSRVTRIVTPLKPFEAMATGRAVLVSDVDALKEIVTVGKTGEAFRAGEVDALYRACVALIENPAHRRELGAAAAAWVRRERSWTSIVARYPAVYDAAKRRGMLRAIS